VAWGVNTTSAVTASTVTDQRFNPTAASSAATGGNTVAFSSTANAIGPPDTSTSDVTLQTNDTTSASATLHVSAYSYPAASDIPANATITAVRARIVHRETGSNPDINKFHFSVRSGTVNTGSGFNSSSSLQADTFALAVSDFSTAAKRAAATVDVIVSEDPANNNGTRTVKESVDSVQLSFDYTTPALPGLVSEAGTCITAATPCPLIGTSGNFAQNIYIHGTIYAPLAAIQLHLTNQAAQTIDRGVVVRTVTANITPASTYSGPLFGLPATTSVTITDPRRITFTAVIGGGQVATAYVEYDDSTTPATPKVLSWNVRHCGSSGC
jgi:hypothetical protein